MNDSDSLKEYEYPEEVKFVIQQNYQKDYIQAVTYINTSNADICILEYGFKIFGGENGIYIVLYCTAWRNHLLQYCKLFKRTFFFSKIIIQEIAPHLLNKIQ